VSKAVNNVAPQTFQPVVRLNGDTGEGELVLMRWGVVKELLRPKKDSDATIQVRRSCPTPFAILWGITWGRSRVMESTAKKIQSTIGSVNAGCGAKYGKG
jgi:hypothetical protein